MNERTELRLKLLANGYTPLLNHDKRTFLNGWQEMKVDEPLIRSWDRSVHKATGIRVENGLGVFDIDVGDAARGDLVDALAQRVAAEIDEAIFSKVLVRRSTGVKEAWFARVADRETFRHFRSRKWARPGDDPDDPSLPKFQLEVFGGGASRQFGSFGPHSFDDRGAVKAEYEWEGPSPADTPLAMLPVYGKGQFARACDIFDQICGRAGLIPIAKARSDSDPSVLYVLESDTLVDMRDGSRLSVAELEKLAPDLHSGTEYLRCSGSFHDPVRTNRTSHSIAIGRHGIGIYDFQDGVTYCLASRKPPERYDISETLRRFSEAQFGAAQGEAQGEAIFANTDDEEADDSDEDADARAVHAEARGTHYYEEEEEAEEEEAEEEEEEEEAGAEDERRAVPYDAIEIVDDAVQTHRNAIAWLVEEMAWDAKANKGNGIVRPIYPDGGAPITVASLRTVMRPYDWSEIGPKGGVKRHSPVDTWLMLAEKVVVEGVRMMPAAPRPLFRESGLLHLNSYGPPRHPRNGGSIDGFDTFMQRLIPDDGERTWFMNWLAYKVQHPEARMVVPLMLARDTGAGRGKLCEILQRLFGERFVVGTNYRNIAGGEGARFNPEFADKLIIWVNEAKSSEGHRYNTRRSEAEALKDWAEPNGDLLCRVEGKGVDARYLKVSVSTIACTNNVDGVPLYDNDRRVAVFTNGPQMTTAEVRDLETWLLDPVNIGALYRTLKTWRIESDTGVFNPYMAPKTVGRATMIEATKSELDGAWEQAAARLEDAADLYTMAQIVFLTRHFAGSTRGHDFDDLVRTHTKQFGFRIGHLHGKNWHPTYNDARERVYTFSEALRRKWSDEEPPAITAELDKAQAAINAPNKAFNKLLHPAYTT